LDFIGTLTLDTDLIFDGLLTIEIDDLSDFDKLFIAGDVDFGLNSLIQFDLETFLPSEGDTFDFLFADNLTGFGAISFSLLDPVPGLRWQVSLTEGNDLQLSFSAIPVPAALPLFGSGLAGLGFLARRRRSEPPAVPNNV